MTLNWINTTGEYILGSIVKDTRDSDGRGGRDAGTDRGTTHRRFLRQILHTGKRARSFLQLFVVSRIVKYFGVSWAVMILPALSFGAYNVLVFVPTLTAVLAAKVAENSTDYSLNNTVRNMLFLPCTYEQKFARSKRLIRSSSGWATCSRRCSSSSARRRRAAVSRLRAGQRRARWSCHWCSHGRSAANTKR